MVKSILLFAMVFITASAITSCTKDVNKGEPRIKYIRITDPESSDSLLVGAYQGNLIAIVGENLEGAQQIWFNDQAAVLTPTYITSTTILVSVPTPIPTEITNTIKIVFSGGFVLEHQFEVQVSEPVISSMDCEYVPAGGTATIRGNYFYEPLTVTFAGGAVAEILSVTDQLLTLKVPDAVQPGPVTITTNFGVTESSFWFNDNRNIFISSDPFTGWWNASYVVTNPGAADPVAINGNYIRVQKAIGTWSWNEVAGGPPSAMGDISKQVPAEAILKPRDYYLKFEVNTVKPYTNNVFKINVGLSQDFNNEEYKWLPPYDTKGQWQTVTIPFEEVIESYENTGSNISVSPDGYYARLLFHGPGDLDCDIAFDNFRVVPKTLR